MMATRRMMTRLQSKKDSNLVARNDGVSPTKRKTSAHPVDDENNLNDNSTASLNKSYPQDYDTSHRKIGKRAVHKTDNPGKQRQTLSERGVNTMRSSEAAKKTEHKAEDANTKTSCRTGRADESSTLLDTSEVGQLEGGHYAGGGGGGGGGRHSKRGNIITQDEITQLEEHTTVEEMICEEALAAALPPLVKGNYHISRPTFYNSRCSFDTSMEVDPWREVHERTPRHQLPRGVVDIDKDSDALFTCVYSNDIFDYLKLKELQSPLPPSFLETSPEVTPRMRGVLMDWLLQVQAHEELEEETLHMSVALIDRYLSLVRVYMPSLQLVGITCLLVATKFLERFAPEISTLCYLTANSFKPHQVISYEMEVLITLAFDLSIPVSVTFLRRYLQVHEDQQPQEVTSLAYYILDLSITSAKMAAVLPSLLATSAVYLARRLVLGPGQAWTASLAYYTSYTNTKDLVPTVNQLANLLYKAPSSKFQGARNKYNTEQHCFISHSRIISPEAVESQFLTEVSAV